MMNPIAALALAAALTAGAPATAQDTIQITAPDGARLEVQNRRGTIHIRGHDGDQVRAWSSGGDRAMQVQQSGSVIRVSISERWRSDRPRPPAPRRPPRAPRPETSPPHTDPDPGGDVDVEVDDRDVDLWIRAPRDTRLSVRGVQAEIRVDSIDASVEVQSVAEAVHLSDIRGRVDVKTVGNDVRLRRVVGEIQAQTVGGDLDFQGVQSERVRATTTGGDVFYDGTIQDGGDYSFSSHGEDVWVAVPQGTSAVFDVNVRSRGGLNANFDLPGLETDERGWSHRFVLGDGSARVDVRTFQGSVFLRRPENMPDRSSGRSPDLQQ